MIKLEDWFHVIGITNGDNHGIFLKYGTANIISLLHVIINEYILDIPLGEYYTLGIYLVDRDACEIFLEECSYYIWLVSYMVSNWNR